MCTETVSRILKLRKAKKLTVFWTPKTKAEKNRSEAQVKLF